MKKFIPVMVVGLGIYMMPAAFASSAQLSGDVTVKYERDTAEGSENTSGTISTLKLKAEKEIDANLSLYVRVGAQYATNLAQSDFNTDVYNKKAVAAIDQFGLTYKGGNITYKLGRQDASVGTTALLYSRADSNIGKHSFVDGISLLGTMGNMEVSALLAREDNAGTEDNDIYAVHAAYKPLDKLQYGFTLGQYRDKVNGNTNHWAIDAGYEFGRNTVTAEYTKSNSQSQNTAYDISWKYAFNDKTSAYITGFKVENNGAMGQQSDFDNDNRGFHYGISHQMTDTTAFEIVYKNQKSISDNKRNTAFEMTFSRSF